MNKDEEYMLIALKEAEKAFEEDEVPVGCVLVCEDKIIATGHNSKEKDGLITSHAEINCITKAQKELGTYCLDNCTLYVSLEPCTMCASALQQAKIKRIVYGARDEKNGACGGLFDLFLIPKMNYYPLLSSGVKEEECKEILKKFFQKKR